MAGVVQHTRGRVRLGGGQGAGGRPPRPAQGFPCDASGDPGFLNWPRIIVYPLKTVPKGAHFITPFPNCFYDKGRSIQIDTKRCCPGVDRPAHSSKCHRPVMDLRPPRPWASISKQTENPTGVERRPLFRGQGWGLSSFIPMLRQEKPAHSKPGGCSSAPWRTEEPSPDERTTGPGRLSHWSLVTWLAPGRAETQTQVCLGASGPKAHTLRLSVPRRHWTDKRDPGVSGQTLVHQLQNSGPHPSSSMEKGCRQPEGPFAVPASRRKRASLPLPGVGRAGSNFPTMCKLVNLRVCKRGAFEATFNEALH